MDSNRTNRNDLMHLNDEILDCLSGLIREYFNQVSIKYRLPELDDLLSHTYHAIKSELEEEKGEDEIVLFGEDETGDRAEECPEFISEEDFTSRFSREPLTKENILPTRIKERLDPVDSLLVESFCLLLEEDKTPIAIFNLEKALFINPDHPVAFVFYNFFKSGGGFKDKHFFEAMSKAPYDFDSIPYEIARFISMISSLYKVILPGEYLDIPTIKEFLSFFRSNEVHLFNLLRNLSFHCSPENMLAVIQPAMEMNPEEIELQVLKVWILFDLHRYNDAFRIAKNLDIEGLDINTDDIFKHQRVYAELLEIEGERGKAFLELIDMVENQENEGSLSDDYFEACLLLIKYYNQQEEFHKSARIFAEILDEKIEYFVDYYGYRFFTRKAEMLMGMQRREEAILCMQKARTCGKK